MERRLAASGFAGGFVGALFLTLVHVGCSTTSATPGVPDGQAPCPADLPAAGSACSPEGSECGYETTTNACGADNCYCQGGAWNCGPTCVLGDSSGAVEDAGDGGPSTGCFAGCLCSPVDACPTGCYPSQTEQPDGSASAAFCSNGIVACVASGVAWSVGTPMNNCGSGAPVYVDGGPDGSFCCGTGPGDAGPEGGDAGADAAPDGGPADAHAE